MPFDAIFLSAVTQELQQPLQGAKVDKIYQPERDTLVLQLRGSQGAKRLLLTANPRDKATTSATTVPPESPPRSGRRSMRVFVPTCAGLA